MLQSQHMIATPVNPNPPSSVSSSLPSPSSRLMLTTLGHHRDKSDALGQFDTGDFEIENESQVADEHNVLMENSSESDTELIINESPSPPTNNDALVNEDATANYPTPEASDRHEFASDVTLQASDAFVKNSNMSPNVLPATSPKLESNHHQLNSSMIAANACAGKACAKKSFVWKYFHHPDLGDGMVDRSRTKCILCESQLAFNASGTTTTMLNHLKSRHSEVAEQEEVSRRLTKQGKSGNCRNNGLGPMTIRPSDSSVSPRARLPGLIKRAKSSKSNNTSSNGGCSQYDFANQSSRGSVGKAGSGNSMLPLGCFPKSESDQQNLLISQMLMNNGVIGSSQPIPGMSTADFNLPPPPAPTHREASLSIPPPPPPVMLDNPLQLAAAMAAAAAAVASSNNNTTLLSNTQSTPSPPNSYLVPTSLLNQPKSDQTGSITNNGDSLLTAMNARTLMMQLMQQHPRNMVGNKNESLPRNFTKISQCNNSFDPTLSGQLPPNNSSSPGSDIAVSNPLEQQQMSNTISPPMLTRSSPISLSKESSISWQISSGIEAGKSPKMTDPDQLKTTSTGNDVEANVRDLHSKLMAFGFMNRDLLNIASNSPHNGSTVGGPASVDFAAKLKKFAELIPNVSSVLKDPTSHGSVEGKMNGNANSSLMVSADNNSINTNSTPNNQNHILNAGQTCDWLTKFSQGQTLPNNQFFGRQVQNQQSNPTEASVMLNFIQRQNQPNPTTIIHNHNHQPCVSASLLGSDLACSSFSFSSPTLSSAMACAINASVNNSHQPVSQQGPPWSMMSNEDSSFKASHSSTTAVGSLDLSSGSDKRNVDGMPVSMTPTNTNITVDRDGSNASAKRKRGRPIYISPEIDTKRQAVDANNTSSTNEEEKAGVKDNNVEDDRRSCEQPGDTAGRSGSTNSYEHRPCKTLTEQELQLDICRFLVKDFHPPELVEGEGFKTLISKLTTCPLPSGNQLRHNVMQRLRQSIEQRQLELCTTSNNIGCLDCAISLEFWSPAQQQKPTGFVNLSVNRLELGCGNAANESPQKLKRRFCQCIELSNQSDDLLKALKKWSGSVGRTQSVERQSPIAIMTNQPDRLSESIDGWSDEQGTFIAIPCLLTEMNKALTTTLELEAVDKFMTNLTQKVTSTTIGDDNLSDNTIESPSKSSVKSWAACFELLKKAKDAKLDEGDRSSVESMLDIVQTMNKTLDLIKRNDLVLTGSMIVPMLANLFRTRLACNNQSYCETSLDVGQLFKQTIADGLRKAYPSDSPAGRLLHTASLLDPRFKLHLVEQLPNCVDLLKAKLEAMRLNGLLVAEPTSPLQSQTDTTATESNTSSSSVNDSSGDKLQTVFGLHAVAKSPPQSELDRYLCEAAIGLEEDPIGWWASKEKQYPNLTSLARTHLALPLTCIDAGLRLTAAPLMTDDSCDDELPGLADCCRHDRIGRLTRGDQATYQLLWHNFDQLTSL